MISWPRLLSGLVVSVGLLADGAVIAQPILEDQILVPQALTPDSGYGVAIDSEQDIAVVGANAQDTPARGSGAAYVYQRINGDWVEQQMLTASNGVAGDQFGRSVAVDGDTMVISAPGGGIFSGKVYVFGFENDQWIEQQILIASDSEEQSWFGAKIALYGNLLVVADPIDDIPSTGNDSGSAYVFEFNGSSWVETMKLAPPGTRNNDRMGSAVATNGTHILVGSPGDDDRGSNAGAIYVYEKVGGSWTNVDKLYAGASVPGYNLGTAIALHSTIAMSSAIGDAGSGGIVLLYRNLGTSWLEDGLITQPVKPHIGYFGTSLSIMHSRAAVGAIDIDSGGSGAVFLYKRTNTGWVSEDELNASTGAPGDAFGRSISISPHGIFVGATGDDDAGIASGAAFVFDIETQFECTADTNNDGILTPTDFTAWINAFNNQLPECDQNSDGACTPTDFTAWIANYNAGCP